MQSYAYHEDTMAGVRALPGVAQATAAGVPLGGNDEHRGMTIDGYTPPDGEPIRCPTTSCGRATSS